MGSGAYLFQIELHFNERQAAWIAAEFEVADERAIGVILMFVGVEERTLYDLQELSRKANGQQPSVGTQLG